MGGLLGALVLSLTVVAVVAIGIMAAFAAVILILQAFATQTEKAAKKPALVPNQARAAHAGGD